MGVRNSFEAEGMYVFGFFSWIRRGWVEPERWVWRADRGTKKTIMSGEWDNERKPKKKRIDVQKKKEITNERVDRPMGQDSRGIRMEWHSRTEEEKRRLHSLVD